MSAQTEETPRISHVTIKHEGVEKTVTVIKHPVIEDVVMLEVRKVVYEKVNGLTPLPSSFTRDVKQELFQDIQSGD